MRRVWPWKYLREVKTTRQEKGLECQRNRKEADAPREDRGARSKSGRVLEPRKGVWALFLGPCTMEQESRMTWSHVHKITLAAELQMGLEGGVAAKRPVRRQLQKSRQETVLAGNGWWQKNETEKQVDRQGGYRRGRTDGICCYIDKEKGRIGYHWFLLDY